MTYILIAWVQLKLIFRKNAGGVANPTHLYDAFEKQMRKEGKFLPQVINITSVFEAFANQVGYPCVTVSRNINSNKQKIDIEIKQVSFVVKIFTCGVSIRNR